MITKNHDIQLKDTSEAEMARFRQIMLGIWRQQIEDDKNIEIMNQYIKLNDYKHLSEATNNATSDENKLMYSNVNANGHYYNKNGNFEGKINIANNKGNVNDVYVCDEKGNEKNTFVNAVKLDITHENFCYIAGIIKVEDSSTFESAAATTQATFNAVKFEKGDQLSMEEQSKFAKKLLQLNGNMAYSTVDIQKKIPLDDNENGVSFKNARKGLIHVLQGKKDYSEGAVLWDGIDFADRGITHNKATKEGGISITKELWTEFINNSSYTLDSKGVQRLDFHKKGSAAHDKDKTKKEAIATIPFEEKKKTSQNYSYNIFNFGEKKKNIWDIYEEKGIKNVDYYETVGTKNNSGRVLHKATVTYGGHIFWKFYYEHPNNKGYSWKYYMNHKL